MEDRDYDNEARAQGWKPQEEYEGDSEKWVDAKTFVERGDKYVGIVKDRLDRTEKRLKYQEQLNNDFKRYMERQEKAHAAQLNGLAAQLEQERKRAVSAGDGEAFDRAEKRLQDVRKQQDAVKIPQEQTQQSGPPPEWAQEWMQENPWYGKDRAATAVAETYAKELREAQPFLEDREFMDEVAKYVKTELPHKFENKKKTQAPEVEIEAQTSVPQTKGPKTYNSMPPEAKAEFNRLAKEGIFKASDEGRAKYAALYWE
jgi:hypothetical protein